VNQAELLRLGVSIQQVHEECTLCAQEGGDPKYFSYRRGDRNARQLSMISIQSKK